MKRYAISRPFDGISLNAGFPQYLRKGEEVLTFPTEHEALLFADSNEIDVDTINIVEYNEDGKKI